MGPSGISTESVAQVALQYPVARDPVKSVAELAQVAEEGSDKVQSLPGEGKGVKIDFEV